MLKEYEEDLSSAFTHLLHLLLLLLLLLMIPTEFAVVMLVEPVAVPSMGLIYLTAESALGKLQKQSQRTPCQTPSCEKHTSMTKCCIRLHQGSHEMHTWCGFLPCSPCPMEQGHQVQQLKTNSISQQGYCSSCPPLQPWAWTQAAGMSSHSCALESRWKACVWIPSSPQSADVVARYGPHLP